MNYGLPAKQRIDPRLLPRDRVLQLSRGRRTVPPPDSGGVSPISLAVVQPLSSARADDGWAPFGSGMSPLYKTIGEAPTRADA